MAYSMTGMGKASGEIKDPPLKIDVEIKSYNHRFLEISVKCPAHFAPFEDEIRRFVQQRVSRGHIVVIVQQDRELMSTTIEVDKPLLQAYLTLINELKQEHKVGGSIDINTLLSINGLIKFSQPQIDAENIFQEFTPILEQAMDAFLEMKRKEGTNIADEIMKSLDIIRRNAKQIEQWVPERNDNYKDHLAGLVKRTLKEYDEDRFYQELLYTIDRTDITEECKRLASHLQLFDEALSHEEHPGRKLNFILQEMQREANTCSVKANCLEISKAIIQVKEEIEKIREQVQNLE
jgi:uncharacterized protein (TIGR00255 family)